MSVEAATEDANEAGIGNRNEAEATNATWIEETDGTIAAAVEDVIALTPMHDGTMVSTSTNKEDNDDGPLTDNENKIYHLLIM